jgi:hypothetical protein
LRDFKKLVFDNFEEFKYLGCFADGPARDLPYLKYAGDVLTNEVCAEKCLGSGYAYAATQYAYKKLGYE